jgi:hypothetical protein
MQESFVAFITDPTPENYLAVRQAVVTHPDYHPYGDALRDLRAAYEAGQFARVPELFVAHIATLLLSGEAHFIAALAQDKLGHDDLSQMEKFLAFRCVSGILGSGDGSRDRPYLVTGTADEYDALNALSKESRGQSLHREDDGRALDRQQVDGGDVWFDVTAPLAAMSRRMAAVGTG